MNKKAKAGQKKCEHKLAGKKRNCKLAAETNSKCCWQHQETPLELDKEMDAKLAKYMKMLEGGKRRKNPVRRKPAKKSRAKNRAKKNNRNNRKAKKNNRRRNKRISSHHPGKLGGGFLKRLRSHQDGS